MPDVDLSDLDAYAAVARHRSFRQAARLRNVSASSLSATIQRLESRLGVRLLNRTTRSVTPTEAGERLLERLGPALRDVKAAVDTLDAFRESPRGTLRLNVPLVVAQVILPSIAARFLADHPGVTLDVTSDDSFIDVLAAGFDAGVRYEERISLDMIAVPLGPRTQRYAAGASAAYLARHGHPSHPRDLLDHACLRHRFPSGALSTWEFEREGEVVRVAGEGPMVAGNLEMLLAAACAGLGVIASFEEYLRPLFASSRLEPILPDWWQSFPGPLLYYPSRRYMPAPLRVFVDFLKRDAQSET